MPYFWNIYIYISGFGYILTFKMKGLFFLHSFPEDVCVLNSVKQDFWNWREINVCMHLLKKILMVYNLYDLKFLSLKWIKHSQQIPINLKLFLFKSSTWIHPIALSTELRTRWYSTFSQQRANCTRGLYTANNTVNTNHSGNFWNVQLFQLLFMLVKSSFVININSYFKNAIWLEDLESYDRHVDHFIRYTWSTMQFGAYMNSLKKESDIRINAN